MNLYGFFGLVCLTASNIQASPEDELRGGNKQFSANLYKQVANTKPNQNIIFSPFTVQTVLATLASAASNSNSETVTQIRNSVGLPQTKYNTEQAFQSILQKLNKANDDFKIFDATKLYFANGYSVQDWYRHVAQNVYQAEVENVNFRDSQNTINNINAWVSKKTNNKITNFVASADIPAYTQNVIINALYAMGKWEKPFDKAETVSRNFFGSQGVKQVEMMVNSQTYEYAEDNSAQFLKLGLLWDEGDAYVLFVLPRDKAGLAQLEKNIGELFKPRTYYAAKVDVILPKFSIENDVKLKPLLQKLGVQKLFAFGAELSGLRYPGHPYTVVSDVFQKAFIEVSEWGITAAVVTDAEVFVDEPQEHKVFTADHPFLFQVVVDDIIVFAGRVVNL